MYRDGAALGTASVTDFVEYPVPDQDSSEWRHTDGRLASWPLVDGRAMQVNNGDLLTKQAFGDFRLHVEFKVPQLPPEVIGQDRGNSGVYLQERYEVQILDSYGDTTLADNEAGAIYPRKAPDVNAARPPETWQTYDIWFRAARYDAAGTKTEDARVTVVWNGEVVHRDFAIPGVTGGSIPEARRPARSGCRTTATRCSSATSGSSRRADHRDGAGRCDRGAPPRAVPVTRNRYSVQRTVRWVV